MWKWIYPLTFFSCFIAYLCVPDITLKTWKAVVMNFIWQYTEPKPNSLVLLRPPTMGSLTVLRAWHIISELSRNKEPSWNMFYTCGQSYNRRLIQNENSMRKFLRSLLHKKEIKNNNKKFKVSSLFGLPWYTQINRKKKVSLHLSTFTILVRNKPFFTQSNVYIYLHYDSCHPFRLTLSEKGVKSYEEICDNKVRIPLFYQP